MRLVRENQAWRALSLLGFVALVWVASAAFAADAPAKTRASCAPRGATIDARAGLARVFHTAENDVYVCRPRFRRRVGRRFDPVEDLGDCFEDVSKFVLRPRYTAWASQRGCGDDFPYWKVSVLRISAGARKQTYPTGMGCVDNGVPCVQGYARRSIGPVERIALTPRGRLAWSAQDQVERQFFEISRIIQGRPVLLARGTGIDAQSIRWGAPFVSWTQDGVLRSG